MQADEVQNAKEPIAAQIDLSGQTLTSGVLWGVLQEYLKNGEELQVVAVGANK